MWPFVGALVLFLLLGLLLLGERAFERGRRRRSLPSRQRSRPYEMDVQKSDDVMGRRDRH